MESKEGIKKISEYIFQYDSQFAGSKIIYINHYSYLKLRNKSIDTSNLEIRFDGILFCIQYLILCWRYVKRRSFDFTSDAENVLRNSKKITLIGGLNDDIKRVSNFFNEKYGKKFNYLNGYDFTHKEYIENVDEESNIIIGLGSPKQEHLLNNISSNSRIIYTCGGFLTQTATSLKKNKKEYYPKIISKFGLRWLYRLFKTNYVWKRLFFLYPLSFILMTYDYIKYQIRI